MLQVSKHEPKTFINDAFQYVDETTQWITNLLEKLFKDINKWLVIVRAKDFCDKNAILCKYTGSEFQSWKHKTVLLKGVMDPIQAHIWSTIMQNAISLQTSNFS